MQLSLRVEQRVSRAMNILQFEDKLSVTNLQVNTAVKYRMKIISSTTSVDSVALLT